MSIALPVQRAEARCQPYHIGKVSINPPVILAPMADVTNGAFRRLCKRIGGPGLLCTEQISTQAIHYRNQRTFKMFDWEPEERPLSVQLFGADPAIMAEAARIVVDAGADIVDINMGCWVPKVCRQGAGAALLKDEATAVKVVDAVVRASSVPVTVKMRAGWDTARLTSTALAREFELRGAQAFALHARTAQQGYTGDADWRWIAEIKAAVNKPVAGNGDIRTVYDAGEMLRQTGCDGVMIGRAAIGNPWILRDVIQFLETGSVPTPPTRSERTAAALEHVTALARSLGETHAVVHLRGQLPLYVKGLPGAVRIREKMVRACTIAEVEEILSAPQPEDDMKEPTA